MSQFFPSGGQSIGVSASASASVLPTNIQDWFPLGWTGWKYINNNQKNTPPLSSLEKNKNMSTEILPSAEETNSEGSGSNGLMPSKQPGLKSLHFVFKKFT